MSEQYQKHIKHNSGSRKINATYNTEQITQNFKL
jgi:hypothetical protein